MWSRIYAWFQSLAGITKPSPKQPYSERVILNFSVPPARRSEFKKVDLG